MRFINLKKKEDPKYTTQVIREAQKNTMLKKSPNRREKKFIRIATE